MATSSSPVPDGTETGSLDEDLQRRHLYRLSFTALPQPVSVERRGKRNLYRANDFTGVRLGSGGPKVTLSTLNGDVRIVRRAP